MGAMGAEVCWKMGISGRNQTLTTPWESKNKICIKKFNLLMVGSKLGPKKVKLEEPHPRPLGHPTWYNYGKRKTFC